MTSEIAESAYLAERNDPAPGQRHYLHLSDLLQAIRRFASADRSRTILDYGCGGSPYRALFNAATEYERADFESSPGIDYVIGQDSRIESASGRFDLILSTQVLEHVEHVGSYLSECARLLVPGGKVLITTHGLFEDHACPHDFRRWTADGLKRDLEAAGFRVSYVEKLTTEGRAVAFLLRSRIDQFCVSEHSRFSGAFRFMRWVLVRYNIAFHRWCDRVFAENRVVDASRPEHVVYIGLVAVAVKS